MSWVEQNESLLTGLDRAAEMIRLAAAAIAGENLDEESMVILSIKMDYLLMAMHALAENNSSAGLDDELSQLFQGE